MTEVDIKIQMDNDKEASPRSSTPSSGRVRKQGTFSMPSKYAYLAKVAPSFLQNHPTIAEDTSSKTEEQKSQMDLSDSKSIGNEFPI